MIAAEPAGELRDTMAASLLNWTDIRHNALAFNRTIEALPAVDRAAAIGGLLETQPGKDVPQGFDPRRFAEILAAAPESEAHRVAVERLGNYWRQMDPGWAMEWALSLEGEKSARATAGVAKG